jgi:hypothetical protein
LHCRGQAGQFDLMRSGRSSWRARDLAQRVVVLLVLLYALPLPRIVQLTPDDVIVDPGGVRLRLG